MASRASVDNTSLLLRIIILSSIVVFSTCLLQIVSVQGEDNSIHLSKIEPISENSIYLSSEGVQTTNGRSVENYITYNLTVYNNTYPIRYQISNVYDVGNGNNRLESINLMQVKPALLVNLSTNSYGKLMIEIPRILLDSKFQNTSKDAGFTVFIDGQNVTSHVSNVNKDFYTRTIVIGFGNSTKQIEILGSKMIPTFINDGHDAKELGVHKIAVGIVVPTFTAAAYNNAFYNFYQAYDHTPSTVTNITHDLEFLTASIPKAGPAYRLLDIVNYTKKVLPDAHVSLLTDQEIDEGKIFERSINNVSSNIYDLLILGHQEYVTQKEYLNFKDFVANGGVLVFLDANVFIAEVSYDKTNGEVTLVKGHNWAFNGKTAWRSVNERWANETKEWVGSNFYYWGGNTNINLNFTNNPFGYTHNEEQYVTNPRVRVIHDYGAVVQEYHVRDNVTYNLGYPKPIIATYDMNFHDGKVIVLSIYSDDVITNDNFQKFFGNMLRNYAKIP